jgi:hypothetical protein
MQCIKAAQTVYVKSGNASSGNSFPLSHLPGVTTHARASSRLHNSRTVSVPKVLSAVGPCSIVGGPPCRATRLLHLPVACPGVDQTAVSSSAQGARRETAQQRKQGAAADCSGTLHRRVGLQQRQRRWQRQQMAALVTLCPTTLCC